MSAIYEEVTITWGVDDDGNPIEYTVTPNYSDVQALENRNISVLGVVGKMQNGDIPAGKFSQIIAYLLNKAGAKVDAEEVYTELMAADPDDFVYVCNQIAGAFIPSKKSGSRSQFSRKKSKKRSKNKTGK